MRGSDYDVIIASGFGKSVAAMRAEVREDP